ncbi:acyl-CoA synthetase (AMP-forming)/AMP-acid ligase II [Saccharothrix ecbatanensis]|uniref:Acyl-CoA synthetase (AMP-forming)/AMP-acid ligase II n=1 Tax=Saccharothrix ecbatanensis TaxID=1105145 RepID=A0A7W9M084_9PSEU|nr:non-ribosomal peptide synthetase [Saccharothrix ecbatanensis]MBB5802705.1 acyl-CoA synthetase (AMP-forming)/AMP-acid ligase II [Saccharothrix ecbatanensis]
MTATADLGFAAGLAAHGDRVALVSPDGTAISYRELDDRVAAATDRLGPVRRLVLLAVRNDVDSLVAYLAALRGGHPVLLTSPTQVDALTSAYDPDVVVDGRWTEHRTGTAHELHPDLALLLSTSGSTGSPKLVRLSADNLAANAEAIAEYLDLRATDRSITSLPMHYCYGLSVVNSNLLRGAGLVLTDRSVVDPEFWAVVREHGVTGLHGVPHTFDLLDRVGFERLDLPSLRYVTQAGGRLAPDSVRRFARLGERRGWRLFVMYGQTEATARMAYLPPELARDHPSSIGVPIPGGEFDIAADGELVYRGPNVMLGYAHRPADLALGRTTGELRTGDLARRTPEGLYEVVGRKNRFVKLFGLRIDLDRVERVLAEDGFESACAGTDDGLVVAVRGAVRRVDRLVRERCGLPGASVRVVRVGEFPRLPNGKVDYAAVARLGRPPAPEDGSVRQVFASALGVSDVPDDATFVDLGGDSLSYVRTSVALERVLGPLPEDWPTTPVAELEGRRAPVSSRMPSVEMNIVLRALAIVLVVGSHIEFFDITGGAHLLLVIAGWNFARFVLPMPGRMLRSAALIAAPAVLWLAYRAAVTDDVTVVNVVLVNNFVGTGAVGYWFVEVVVHALVVFALLFAVPFMRRVERAHGFLTALAFLGVSLLLRIGFDASSSFAERNMTTLGAVWFFVLGWLVQRAGTRWQKALVLVLAFLLIPDTFDDPAREAVVWVGLVLLLGVARVRLPKPVVAVVTLLAGASLYIYLTHYAVFPALLDHLPLPLVVVASLAVGVVVWQVGGRYQQAAARWCRRVFAEPARVKGRR